jgi:hypothetical protein
MAIMLGAVLVSSAVLSCILRYWFSSSDLVEYGELWLPILSTFAVLLSMGDQPTIEVEEFHSSNLGNLIALSYKLRKPNVKFQLLEKPPLPNLISLKIYLWNSDKFFSVS